MKIYIVLIAFLVLFVFTFFQEYEWFKYAVTPPLVIIFIGFFYGTIAWLKILKK